MRFDASVDQINHYDGKKYRTTVITEHLIVCLNGKVELFMKWHQEQCFKDDR